MQDANSHHTLKGTLAGTLAALAVSIDPADLLKTAVMAATGATVSFLMSVFLHWLKDRFK